MLTRPTTPQSLVRRMELRLPPDPARVVNQLFVAGEELSFGNSRASPVMERVLALSDREAEAVLADTLVRFDDRHPNLRADLLAHYAEIGDRLGPERVVSETRRLLLGAYATNEYAIEAAALCNPSIVAHPDQTGLQPGQVRFVLSLRAVGEGHLSSIEFRTGTIDAQDHLEIDEPGPLVADGHRQPSRYDREQFRALAGRSGHGGEVVSLILDGLPATFSGPELDGAIARLHPQVLTRKEAREVVERIRAVARSNYTIGFAADRPVAERVIRPKGPTESHGMEDARFVRFVDDDGTVTYFATYTAFDGSHVAPQLLRTDDFVTFDVSQLVGRAAANKGMALFPRRLSGRYAALSRWDRERNAITTSADGHAWDDSVDLQAPDQPWELIQIGNCGSPIETAEGWLVVTHGVGPLRTYAIGAMLLDLDDPRIVRAKLRDPLLTPSGDEREGYVPNVVYSCGAMIHGDTLVLPYAFGDRVTTFAMIPVSGLLELLLSS